MSMDLILTQNFSIKILNTHVLKIKKNKKAKVKNIRYSDKNLR